MSETKFRTEEFKVEGERMIGKIKEMIHEGNIRRIRVLQDNKVVMEIPLTAGAIAIAAAPLLAALGAFAALATDCTIEVEKMDLK